MSHFAFIAASYGATFLGLGLLAGWMIVDYARQRRILRELEARGLGRRARGGATGDDA